MAKAKRKFAPILGADVVGYSCLMVDNEAATVEILTKYRQIFADHIVRHNGHVFVFARRQPARSVRRKRLRLGAAGRGRLGHDVPAASSAGIAVEPRSTL